ncbi:hypothetical protein HBA55_32555 [Pseudomaricurvus alkylphenolicus]|uniref:hypothetical protein n=1 Tax=Pseudomaricurvus alkylphenolicus TaxID=1306991 RepID=UPI001420ED76|nr:hypothetical protein [Pseudomaricurvus alkylphenolicus]NIB44371.1 hypothetical protein [Pseudomaricurvus alkylphenolicus]
MLITDDTTLSQSGTHSCRSPLQGRWTLATLFQSLTLVAVYTLTLAASSASARCLDNTSTDTRFLVYAERYAQTCLDDSAVYAQAINSLDANNKKLDLDKRLGKVIASLNVLKQGVSGGRPNSDSSAADALESALNKAIDTSADLQLAYLTTPQSQALVADEGLAINKWGYGAGSHVIWRAVILQPLLDQGCAARDVTFSVDSTCYNYFHQKLAGLAEIYGIVREQILPVAVTPIGQMSIKRYADRVARWESYFKDTQFQYPWELIVNRRFTYNWHEIAKEDSIPTKRYILLHPDVGALYADNDGDDQTDLALVMQWAGIQWWQEWDKDNRAKHPIGVSVVSTFVDLPEMDEHGFGFMFHYKRFGLSVTKHGDDTAVFFNLKLAEWIDGGDWKAKLKKEGD